LGNICGMHRLIPHPSTPPNSVEAVSANFMEFTTNTMVVEFSVKSPSQLILPPEKGPVRSDGLWRTTCFEVLLQQDGDPTYFELNFSPSLAWAAYAFDAYRDGMRELPVTLPPDIEIASPDGHYFLFAEFETWPHLVNARRLGFSAVIEERDGTKSYWALAHPPGPPDFHHPDCFALALPPPGGA